MDIGMPEASHARTPGLEPMCKAVSEIVLELSGNKDRPAAQASRTKSAAVGSSSDIGGVMADMAAAMPEWWLAL